MARRTVKRTGGPLYPEHPISEHEWRVARARTIMRDDRLDALVLSRNLTVFYATGSRFVFVGWDAPMSLAPQSAAIITQNADIYCQRFGPFDMDTTGLHTTVSESLEYYDNEIELVSILKDYGISKGSRIGFEWGPGQCAGINPIKFSLIKDKITKELGAEVVDGTPTIWKIMAIKSKLETERMRIAVAAAARAMERTFDFVQVDMSEVDVARKASQFMLEEGADKITHAQVTSEGAGPHFLSIDALDRKIVEGFVHLDLGCKYRRYGSDINRGIFLGRKPTKDDEKLYACRLGANEVLDRVIKPGVCMDDALSELNSYVQKCGCVLKDFGGYLFAGHGIGIESYQQPGILPSAIQPTFQNAEGKVLFQPGMMFTFEMAIELPGSDCPFFNVEDDVVVTETGVENMCSMLNRELRVKIGGGRAVAV